ncbi:MAG TPA: Spy/CpxP family protein refolding chaperone [Bacteroidota bacterium]|nr:Spy/CpxP family protein refolding chaperone [Bacteroidota bacterium]
MRLALFGLLVGVTALTLAQHSPYAGEATHPIKSLSPKEVEAYLGGAGMGFAKAAELNHYPGPRHVLDLAEQLHLTTEQTQKARVLYDAMKAEAISLGTRIVEEEQSLDRLFAMQHITREQLEATTNRIAVLQGQLRVTHLLAHLSMKEILTQEQIEKYDELRGYTAPDNTKSKEHQRHH